MHDVHPTKIEELICECRALACAVVSLEEQSAREVLSPLLLERIEMLYAAYLCCPDGITEATGASAD